MKGEKMKKLKGKPDYIYNRITDITADDVRFLVFENEFM